MTAIEIKGLSKSFGNRLAVDSVSLSIEKGELFALLGQNGAGKTTTIKMLCCLLTPDEGDAVLSGDSILDKPESVKQKINVSPQETAVAPNLSIRENLELMAGIYGVKRERISAKVDEMLMSFSLSDRSHEKAGILSGGLQRRLSIAMALISDPEILFLDEPTLGLDVRARRDLWNQVRQLKGRVTIVLTTHYLEEAEALSDRIGIIHQGKIRITGTAGELKRATGKEMLEDAYLLLTEPEG